MRLIYRDLIFRHVISLVWSRKSCGQKIVKTFALSMPRLLTDKCSVRLSNNVILIIQVHVCTKPKAIVEEMLGKDPPQHQFIAAVQWCNEKF